MLEMHFPELQKVHTIVFDFDGVFTNNKVYVDQDGRETVRCDRGDGLAFDFVRSFSRRGLLAAELFVLSQETNPVVKARCDKLGLKCRQGVADKLEYLQDYLEHRFSGNSNSWAGLAYLGNDLNDLPVMCRAGCTIAPADAHPLILSIAHHVLPQRGGEGFVRAFVEKLLGINQLSMEKVNELISDR
jgi:3-deoxy-D-manno-octulosonate 8-phosphate phosphatase (KDO 8-P phosphatase)